MRQTSSVPPSLPSTSPIVGRLDATGHPGASTGGAQGQPGVFTRSHPIPGHPVDPSQFGLALQAWSEDLSPVHAGLDTLPSQQRYVAMANGLRRMAQDLGLPRELRTPAINELASMHTGSGYGAQDFQRFQAWVRDEGSRRIGNAQGSTSSASTGSFAVPMPPDSRALARWASTFERMTIQFDGQAQRDAIRTGLFQMANDPDVPQPFRDRAAIVGQGMLDPGKFFDFIAFEQDVRHAHRHLPADSQAAVDRMLEEATRSIHLNFAQRNPPVQERHGGTAASGETSDLGMVPIQNLIAMQASIATTGMAPAQNLSTSVNQSRSNAMLPTQPGSHANAASSARIAQLDLVDPTIPPNARYCMELMMKDPNRLKAELIKDLQKRGVTESTAEKAADLARLEMAFGAAPANRDRILQLLSEREDEKSFSGSVAQSLRRIPSNPALPYIIWDAKTAYVNAGGSLDGLTLDALRPHVNEIQRRIFDAFVDQEPGYIAPRPVNSSAPATTHDTTGSAGPQPRPPFTHFAQPMPAFRSSPDDAGHPGDDMVTGSVQPKKRQRTGDGPEAAMSQPPVITQGIDPTRQTAAWFQLQPMQQPQPLQESQSPPPAQQAPQPMQLQNLQQPVQTPPLQAPQQFQIPGQAMQMPPTRTTQSPPLPAPIEPVGPTWPIPAALQSQPLQPLQPQFQVEQPQPEQPPQQQPL